MSGLLIMGICGCGVRYTIEGKVKDMKTGQPLEHAHVQVLWEKLQNGQIDNNENQETFGMSITADYKGRFFVPKRTYNGHELVPTHLKVSHYTHAKGYKSWESENLSLKLKRRLFFRTMRLAIELEPFIRTKAKPKPQQPPGKFLFEKDGIRYYQSGSDHLYFPSDDDTVTEEKPAGKE
jgi:hypothetical protein